MIEYGTAFGGERSFDQTVTLALNDGWELVGGASHSFDQAGNSYFTQALKREAEEDGT